jgi:alpha,alpha-trehalase
MVRLSSAHPASRSSTPILSYIKDTWAHLVRSHEDLASAAVDPKYHPDEDGKWPVFVPESENIQAIEGQLRLILGSKFDKIRIKALPRDPSKRAGEGIVYLPRPYAVPGGRFNEMYGWDSFFIAMGLLRDGETALAKDIADNFLYEIREYGKILNANRTYYFSRSQPPLLTETILAVYNRTRDVKWLVDTVPAIEQYYRYWTTEPHLTPETGLSRYYDMGDGPAPEVMSSELDRRGRTDYDLIREYFRTHRVTDYDVSQFYDAASGELTPLFYKGDRSMRESGFDPSNRFGPFSADIIHYNAVCLNSLLVLMESGFAEILETLGRDGEARAWRQRAADRGTKINSLMWDSRHGMYFDYNFVHKQVRVYPYLTTFYPLWTGIASPEQAAAVVSNLRLFERRGGLQTSTVHTGDQWDAPFGWAPLQWIAVQGLRRYGYGGDAGRVSRRFLAMVRKEYEKHGVIDEKYDVVRGRANIGKELFFGYRTNEAGFGWTNAVYTALWDEISRQSSDTRSAAI